MSLPAMSRRRVRWGREKPSYTGQMCVTPSPESTTTPVSSPETKITFVILCSMCTNDSLKSIISHSAQVCVLIFRQELKPTEAARQRSDSSDCSDSLAVSRCYRCNSTLSVESEDGLDGDINSRELICFKHHLGTGEQDFSSLHYIQSFYDLQRS